MKQPDLFAEIDPKPRKKRQWLMHVADATTGASEQGVIAVMQCARCGEKSEWLMFHTVTESKRGIPCEKCNAKERHV